MRYPDAPSSFSRGPWLAVPPGPIGTSVERCGAPSSPLEIRRWFFALGPCRKECQIDDEDYYLDLLFYHRKLARVWGGRLTETQKF